MSNDSDTNFSPKDFTPTEEGEEEDELFYFESDHLALKGNKDYCEILKTIFVLEAQRERAIKDYEKVVEIQKDALKDPLSFTEKFVKGDVEIPPLQRIIGIPFVDWSKFDVKVPEDALKSLKCKDSPSKTNVKSDEIYKSKRSSDTFKKPWTTEEQKRLEELLQVYPPESVEMRRFKKIAVALGNRTVKQVTSRVQKYFLKLYKAGLPIPGRIPKSAEKHKKSKLHQHQRRNHLLWKPSTFFPELDIPVKMNELEDICEVSTSNRNHNNIHDSSKPSVNYLLPKQEELDATDTCLSQTPNDLKQYQLEILKKVKFVKEKENDLCAFYSHFGYKCDYCDDEPIKGTKWHCVTCRNNSVDFCTDCVVSQMYSDDPHPFTHKLQPDFGEITDQKLMGNLYDDSHYSRTSDSEKSESESSLDSESGSNSAMEIATTNVENSKLKKNLQSLMTLKNNSYTNSSMKSYETTDSQFFTDTQCASYEYLRSQLAFSDT